MLAKSTVLVGFEKVIMILYASMACYVVAALYASIMLIVVADGRPHLYLRKAT